MKNISEILKLSNYRMIMILAVFGIIFSTGCTDHGIDSVFDEGADPGETPVVESFSPTEFVYSGVGIMTITGQNLAPEPIVSFEGGVLANIISANENEIVLYAPLYEFGEGVSELDLSFKVMTRALSASDSVKNVKLRPAVIELPKSPVRSSNTMSTPFVLNDGTLIFEEANANGGNRKVVAFTDESTDPVEFASTTGNLFSDIKQGPDGTIFAVTRQFAVFNINPGGSRTTYHVFSDRTLAVSALDFDSEGNIWFGTTSSNKIVKLSPDLTETEFAVEGNVNSMRIYNGSLYINLTRSNEKLIVSYPIENGALGQESLYFNFSNNFESYYLLRDFNFTTDGTTFLTTESTTDTLNVPPLHIVDNSGNVDVFYPQLLDGAVYNPMAESSAWGLNDELYYIKKTVVRNSDGSVEETLYDVVKVLTQRQTVPFNGRD